MNEAYINERLESQIALAREVVSLGRALREKHKLKTRQPLAAVTIVHHDEQVRTDLAAQAHLIEEELNALRIQRYTSRITGNTRGRYCNKKTLEFFATK